MASPPPRTGWVCHEYYYWHDSSLESTAPHVQPHASSEGAESKRRFENLVKVTPLADALVAVKPRPATDAEILRFHTPRYLAHVKAVSASEGGGFIGHEVSCVCMCELRRR
jgi:acetoin utilization deacetylase AcuC-like enzyme